MNHAEKVWDMFIRAYKGDLQAQAEILYVDAMLNGDSRLIKEEKKMLNVDKYRKEVLSALERAMKHESRCSVDKSHNGSCALYSLRNGGVNCGLKRCSECVNETMEWLRSEYQPLLENGDGLKPGDWIMVRDFEENDWLKRQFVYYFEGAFFCSRKGYTPERCEIVRWYQARLPEDGE